MGTTVNFVGNRPVVRQLYFNDLSLNEAFRIVGGDAVYRKARTGRSSTLYMFEEATGKLWPATESPVERVNVEVRVGTSRPSIY